MLINLFWFLAGALIYKFAARLLGLGLSANLYTQTLIGSLIMIKKVDEQMLFVLEKQQDFSEEKGLDEEQVKNARNVNLQAHELWRIMIINTIISCCPKNIRSTLKFKDWQTAMQLLKK